MPRTKEEQNNWQLGCYGMTEDELRADLPDQMDTMGKDMLIMSMLSDVQELINLNNKELARMLVNRVKWALDELPENQRDIFMRKLKQERKERIAQEAV